MAVLQTEWIELADCHSKERFSYLVGIGMNERIKELASKVWYHGNLEEQNENIQMFAELIVRECVAICESGTPTQTTSSGAAELIKLKFGILDQKN
jgi:hypothetical protein